MPEATSTHPTEGEQLSELARRRGFFFPSFESYGGVAGLYTYGPEGAAMKRNLEEAWRDRFTVKEGHFEVDGPTVTPKPVLDASSHTETFDDMLVACGECGETHRADHLVERATSIADAEGLPAEELEELIAEQAIPCPECGAGLAGQPVEPFNLMFETDIGPGDGQAGFLRPETAQSIFVEFPRLIEYARNNLPFGVTQIGRGYRNEISPRKGLVRLREFSMAELEVFVDPERNRPPIDRVADVTLPLYSARSQAEGDGIQDRTVGAALESGLIDDEWVAYYLGVARRWYDRVGLDPARFRFRQHLTEELSHYANDCWDAEAEIDDEWIEIAGFAHRGCYDLEKHQEHSQGDYTVFHGYDDPVAEERVTVDPDMSYLGPEYGANATAVAEALTDLAARDPAAFEGQTVTVTVEEGEVDVPVEHTGFGVETVTETGEHVTPVVIEPSFGVGRTLYAILAHRLRADEVDGEERTYLALPPEVAPTVVAVFPLMDRDGLAERASAVAADLRAAGFDVTYDDSGNIGRRYRRQDEVGTPFCVTVDYDTLEDETVTIRDRDTTAQERVPITELSDVLSTLTVGERTIGGST